MKTFDTLKKVATTAWEGTPDATYQMACNCIQRNNIELAMRTMERAASDGYAQAQYHLGTIYREGGLVLQDPAKAEHWLKEAARNGHPEALMLFPAEGGQKVVANAPAPAKPCTEAGTRPCPQVIPQVVAKKIAYLTKLTITLGMFGWGFVYGFAWTWLLCGIIFITVSLFCPLDIYDWYDYNDELKEPLFSVFVLVPIVCYWYLISGFSATWFLCAIYTALKCYFDIESLMSYKKWEREDIACREKKIAAANQLERQILDGTVTDVLYPSLGVGSQKIVPRHKKYARYYALCAVWGEYLKPQRVLSFKEEEQRERMTKILRKRHPVGLLGVERDLQGSLLGQAMSLKIVQYDSYEQALQTSRHDLSLKEIYTLAYAFEAEEEIFKASYPEQFAYEEKLRKEHFGHWREMSRRSIEETSRRNKEKWEKRDRSKPLAAKAENAPAQKKEYKSFGVMDMAIFYNVGKKVGESGAASLGVVDGWMLREMRNQISQMSPDDQQHAQNTFLAGLAETSGNNKLKQAVMFDSVFKSIFG